MRACHRVGTVCQHRKHCRRIEDSVVVRHRVYLTPIRDGQGTILHVGRIFGAPGLVRGKPEEAFAGKESKKVLDPCWRDQRRVTLARLHGQGIVTVLHPHTVRSTSEVLDPHAPASIQRDDIMGACPEARPALQPNTVSRQRTRIGLRTSRSSA